MIKQEVIERYIRTNPNAGIYKHIPTGVESTMNFINRVTKKANEIEDSIDDKVKISYIGDDTAVITYREKENEYYY